ncbi:MAG: undecaprenyl-diphosphate phosphatase [Deltaproteobacteria bacterium]|nr:undecaprenyl-diphosphate phosphatase [Deltaproteobacteria bacterium]
MLTWYKAIVLGFIQGATEFFPVSSSAHLVIAQNWMGIRESAQTMAAFDVSLHVGTLVAAILFFRWDLAWLIGVWIKPWRAKLKTKQIPTVVKESSARRLGGLVILGIIPVCFVGVFFHQFFEDLFSDTMMVALFLLITGAIINATRKVQNNTVLLENIIFKQALLIGIAQIFSILPGISRSGTSISAGLFVKLNPESSFRFSFFMMIPIVGGAVILELRHLSHMAPPMILSAFLGAVMAGFVGYNCIGLMLRWMRQGKFANFAYYCWTLGTLVILKEMFF